MTYSRRKHSLVCMSFSSSMLLQANDWLEPDMDERFGPFSDCAKSHVAVKPKKGTPWVYVATTMCSCNKKTSRPETPVLQCAFQDTQSQPLNSAYCAAVTFVCSNAYRYSTCTSSIMPSVHHFAITPAWAFSKAGPPVRQSCSLTSLFPSLDSRRHRLCCTSLQSF